MSEGESIQLIQIEDLESDLALAARSLHALTFGEEYTDQVFKDDPQKPSFLLLVATIDGDFTGFKLGFSLNASTFYSRTGAVAEAFRGQGIGLALMLEQHRIVKKLGFQKVQTKSMPEWPAMLALNKKVGFKETDSYIDSKGRTKIVFEKDL